MTDTGNMPIVDVCVNGRNCRALIDTGSSRTMVSAHLVTVQPERVVVYSFDGSRNWCLGTAHVDIEFLGKSAVIRAIATMKLIEGVDLLIGMDVIGMIGGISILPSGLVVVMKDVSCMQVCERREPPIVIEDVDFTAHFDGDKWRVEWKWLNGPPILKNSVNSYVSKQDAIIKEKFTAEINEWIRMGVLQKWHTNCESGIIPLMAVHQKSKGKVRPVLDYRELNRYVSCHTGDNVDICVDTIRRWRTMPGTPKIIDLKRAYLQVEVDPSLRQYQLVNIDGVTYCLTRLGFGLCCAPRIMTIILKNVLSMNPKIDAATMCYMDDILVNESVISAGDVTAHLKKYGLTAKDSIDIEGNRALGLFISRDPSGKLSFKRGSTIEEIFDSVRGWSRRELFSLCGKLVGHYPVAGWLRIACSFSKRIAEGTGWEDDVGTQAREFMNRIEEKVRVNDPVKGPWHVPEGSYATVWCDASDLAIGASLEVDGEIVEDATWLRKKDDLLHINVAELEAVLRGINLAIKWGMKTFTLMTDSRTVLKWVSAIESRMQRVRTKGAAEILIKRRLAVLKTVIEEEHINVRFEFVNSENNKADALTRINMKPCPRTCCATVNCNQESRPSLRDLHRMHHFGVDRSLALARKVYETVARSEIEEIVNDCEECSSIDPPAIVFGHGECGVREIWSRLSVDVTHYQSVPYLTIVDSGPGRFAIWKRLSNESAVCVTERLREVITEHGPPDELLLDNALVFKSAELRGMCDKWGINVRYRAAYRPQGNGIVERNHKTIKRTAARSGRDPTEACFWYNFAPRNPSEKSPSEHVYRKQWRHPCKQRREEVQGNTQFELGERVWVKPCPPRCDVQWTQGEVTRLNDEHTVEVDGIPRHVSHLRPAKKESAQLSYRVDSPVRARFESPSSSDEEDGTQVQRHVRRSSRTRRPPEWMEDYVVDGI